MKIKFNKFERVAGLFVVFSIIGALVFALGVAIKRGWFEQKVYFTTHFNSATGVHPGTIVQINGLRAGAVNDVFLKNDSSVEVEFYVLKKFATRLHEDARVYLIRTFVIGEKIIDLQMGSEELPLLAEGSIIRAEPTFDLMDMFNGREMGKYIETLRGLSENLRVLAQAFADTKRTETLIEVFDRLGPLTQNLTEASEEFITLGKQVNKKGNVGKVVERMAKTSYEVNRLMPEIMQTTKVMNKYLPVFAEKGEKMSTEIEQLVGNLNVLTEQFKVVLPAIAEVAPELPSASRRAIEALDETVITLKALQQSYFFRDGAEEARKELDKKKFKEQEKYRAPSNE